MGSLLGYMLSLSLHMSALHAKVAISGSAVHKFFLTVYRLYKFSSRLGFETNFVKT